MSFLRPFSVWLRRDAERKRQNRRDRQAVARHERECSQCQPTTADEELIRRRSKGLNGR